MSDVERFFSKVDRNGPVPSHRPELGPCHIWTACLSKKGYGQFGFQGKVHASHRVAFFLSHGRWPEPCALHHCDNRACVNDAHLFEGTNDDNVSDRVEKGRNRFASGPLNGRHTKPQCTARGERNGLSKLNEQKVRELRAEYAAGGMTLAQVGAKHGVCKATAHAIVRGKIWAHVTV